jgi:hypothetical protein
LIFDRLWAHNDTIATLHPRQDAIMTHQPPSPPPHGGLHPLVTFLLFVPLILLAIPALTYGLFLAFVLGYSVLSGPIRWN